MKKTIKARPKKMSVLCSPRKTKSYDKDFYRWTKSQANLLRKREFLQLDLENLIEEIESLGRSEKRTLKSYLEILLMHLLKAKFQPKKHTKSWDLSIKEAQHKVLVTLQENPSLKSQLKDIVKDAYFFSRIRAALETNLSEDTFPEQCPWELKDLFPGLEKKYL